MAYIYGHSKGPYVCLKKNKLFTLLSLLAFCIRPLSISFPSQKLDRSPTNAPLEIARAVYGPTLYEEP